MFAISDLLPSGRAHKRQSHRRLALQHFGCRAPFSNICFVNRYISIAAVIVGVETAVGRRMNSNSPESKPPNSKSPDSQIMNHNEPINELINSRQVMNESINGKPDKSEPMDEFQLESSEGNDWEVLDKDEFTGMGIDKGIGSTNDNNMNGDLPHDVLNGDVPHDVNGDVSHNMNDVTFAKKNSGTAGVGGNGVFRTMKNSITGVFSSVKNNGKAVFFNGGTSSTNLPQNHAMPVAMSHKPSSEKTQVLSTMKDVSILK
jgi:hypothetical protein